MTIKTNNRRFVFLTRPHHHTTTPPRQQPQQQQQRQQGQLATFGLCYISNARRIPKVHSPQKEQGFELPRCKGVFALRAELHGYGHLKMLYTVYNKTI